LEKKYIKNNILLDKLKKRFIIDTVFIIYTYRFMTKIIRWSLALWLLLIQCFFVAKSYAYNTQDLSIQNPAWINNSNENIEPLFDGEKIVKFFNGILKGISVIIEETSFESEHSDTSNEIFVDEKLDEIPETENLKIFSDIKWNTHKKFITIMQKKWIVKWYDNKFYPNDNVSLYIMTKMLVQSYRARIWYRLDSNVGLTSAEYFRNMNFDDANKTFLNTAYELWFYKNLYVLKEENPDLNKPVDWKLLEYVLATVAEQIPELVDRDYLRNISWKDDIVKKDELAEHLVRFFQITNSSDDDVSGYIFEDAKYHPHWLSAEILARYGIVNTNTDKFYIDNHIYRADFVVMLVKSFLVKNRKKLNVNQLKSNSITDIIDKPYSIFVQYAKENWYIDYLLEVKREKEYFYPQNIMTKHEVYHILNKLLNAKIEYDIEKADNEHITRWQVASLLVDAFDFKTSLEKENTSDYTNISEFTNYTATTKNSDQIQIAQNQDSVFWRFVNFLNKL